MGWKAAPLLPEEHSANPPPHTHTHTHTQTHRCAGGGWGVCLHPTSCQIPPLLIPLIYYHGNKLKIINIINYQLMWAINLRVFEGDI